MNSPTGGEESRLRQNDVDYDDLFIYFGTFKDETVGSCIVVDVFLEDNMHHKSNKSNASWKGLRESDKAAGI